MASTIQLQRTINLAQQFCRLAPLIFTANTANDPAFSNADWVKQEFLSPPLAHRWNRTGGSPTEPTFVTVVGQSDYPVSLPNFGWIEKGIGYDPNNGYRAFELQVGLIFGSDTTPNEPARIAAQYDDGSGEITFRLFPAPDKIYNIVVESQNAAQLFTDVDDTWDPIPDYLSYVYNQGFQAKAYEYLNDPRWVPGMQQFYTELANVTEGLTSTEKNIWLQDKLSSIRELAKAQQGR